MIDFPCLRFPESLMHPDRLGSFHPSCMSFSRKLIRVMIAKAWEIQPDQWRLDSEGLGYVTYKIHTHEGIYQALFFTQALDSSLRNDRVIAEAWDMTCCLWQGQLQESDIAQLAKQLPLQERGRYSPKVLSISRANKSVRIFQHVIDSLASGQSPSIEELKKIGYLVRTTAVYGNGKFGMADYEQLQSGVFSEHFSAQMMLVFMVRKFTLDWVEYLAKQQNREAIALDERIARYVGIGNSTGLGMMPYLIKHPSVVNCWVKQREQALYEIVHSAELGLSEKNACMALVQRAQFFFRGIKVPDALQMSKNERLIKELALCESFLIDALKEPIQCNWADIWEGIKQQKYGAETEELFLNILLELYPMVVGKYDRYLRLSAHESSINNMVDVTALELLEKIHKNYSWVLAVDFSSPNADYFFWYQSQTKEEPRRGKRKVEAGSEKELPIDIGFKVHKLYDCLNQWLLMPTNQKATLSRFLLDCPEQSDIVKRVLNYDQNPYGEVRYNIIDKSFYPIDLLRLKLSFFGAVKYDPKSDLWLRITLFQGAPLVDSQGKINGVDDWFLYAFDDSLTQS